LGLAALLGLLPALAAPYQLPRKTVDAEPAGELAESSGLRAWDATLAKETRGLQAPKLLAGRVYGLLQAEPARFPVAFPAPGADLDLGYNDFLDLDLMLPPGFAGTVAVEFAAKGIDEDEPMERIVLPLAPLAADGRHRRVRLDLGLVPRWRGFLTRAALVIEPDAASRGKPAAVGMLLVGDTPGDPPARYEELNLKPEMKLSDLLFMESNYIRFHRNLHFKEIIGIDPMPFSTLLHASYFQDHPRLIYADYSMAFDLVDGVHHHHVPWGGWYFDEFAGKAEEAARAGGLLHFRSSNKPGPSHLPLCSAIRLPSARRPPTPGAMASEP
jgi:hypothetical protein